MPGGYAVGVQSLQQEVTNVSPPVAGTIPAWLSGTLIRNGPGRFDVGGQQLTHWFDGLAMLRRYAFADGQLTYSNRFLRTNAYADAMAGETAGEFGTDQRGLRKLLSWLASLGPPAVTDNANVHVAEIDGTHVALTEAPRRIAFDVETLETQGPFRFEDALPEQLTAAHLVTDPETGEWFGFTTEFGPDPQYHLYRVPPDSRSRERIASLAADGPGYVHDCSITAEHVIIVETPLVIPILRAISPFSEGLLDTLDWQPQRATRILVVDRHTGDLVADPTLPPLFTFHHINAFLEDETVVLDLIEFPDAEIVEAMRLETLIEESSAAVPDGRPVRYRIDLASNQVERTQLHSGGMELPRVFSSQVGRRHRYAYGQATDREGANGLVKLDCETGEAQEWWSQGVFVEEPIPIQRPGASAPDDGVVLATALDSERERTRLLVFDAATLEVLADATLPHVEPLGFHGRFFAED